MSRRLQYGIQPPADLFDLADSIRAVMDKMVVIDEPHEELRQAAREIQAIAQRLAPLCRTGLDARMMPDIEPGPGDRRPYYAGDAYRWHFNPIFPNVRFEPGSEGVLRGTVTLGLAYEGPPGCVHGGIVSMLLDQLLGQANLEHGVPAFTGKLTVRYRRPTPLLTALDIEVHPPERIDERKYLTRGWIRAGGNVTAAGEGLFVRPVGDVDWSLPHLKAEHARDLRRRDGERKR
jgi:hypothetical protein